MNKNWNQKLARHRAAKLFRNACRALALASVGSSLVSRAQTPQGMSVARGAVSAVQNGGNLSVTASHNAMINWQSFNIGAGNSTTFIQPSANSVVWNRINDANPSQIFGSLNANGWVVLINQNGFYFGPNSSINVGGFIATTASVIPPPDSAGGFWNFNGPPPLAKIENHGSINVANGGSLFLISEKIENHGTLSAPDGKIGLYAGREVLLSERPDGRGLSATVQMPAGSVDNAGRIVAPGGEIALRAQIVNQNGLIQADSARTRNGVIELVASDSLKLSENSLTQANGDAANDGGKITIKSEGSFAGAAGSRVETQGRNGGAVEISARSFGSFETALDASAAPSGISGSLFFDPYDIQLASGSGDTSSPNFVHSGDAPNLTGDLLTLDVSKAFKTFSNIRLQASHDITFTAGMTWDLNASTGVSAPNSQLTLEAGNNIVFGDNAKLVAGQNWSVHLLAGADFSTATPVARSGVGGIYINGGPPDSNGTAPNLKGSIESANGDIVLEAGHEVLIGGGYVRTSNGGNISVKTGDGDVSSGTLSRTFDFSSTNPGYVISSLGLGGISTGNGGSITVEAGRDILSFTAYIGAFGSPGANVTLNAAQDVKGFFLVRNGIGKIEAGRDVGNPSPAATLGLIAGGWEVHGGRDVYINEIYNPNGSLNDNRLKGVGTVKFQFNYGLIDNSPTLQNPPAYAIIKGDNSVQLVGNGILHTASNSTRPPIYPPRLEVTAGAEGVTLGNDVILAPDPQGSLKITTTGGGSLQSAPGKYAQFVVSDSGSRDYTTFATGHAATPLHAAGLGDGIHLDIAGDLKNIFFRSPMAADIKVGRDAVNFAFEGQNLSANDTTSLTIRRDFVSRLDRTSEKFSDIPDILAVSDAILSAYPSLVGRFSYDPDTGQVTVQGILTPDEVTFLKNPTGYVYDPFTKDRAVSVTGETIIVPVVFTRDFDALDRLALATQDIPTSSLAQGGMQLGGPGLFKITARNMDLGVSRGIRSVGPLKNTSLAGISATGASIDIKTSGDVNITSSQIASFNGGNIKLVSDGRLDVGSQQSFTSDDTPKGIYTGHGGNVDVRAIGDVLVNGSRIASYDGGDVTVVSEQGKVDAGGGARGFFQVTTSQVNADGTVENRNDAFFGSGIMAVTRHDGDARVGNIQVSAAQDIAAGAGGILQIAFNSRDQSAATLTLDAGQNIIADQSGILGRNVTLNAAGDIRGLIIASGNLSVQAQQNVAVTALAGGSANVSGGGTISGTIAGGGNVNVAGSEVSASVISTGGSASTSGESSGSTVGAFATVAATGAQKTADSADKTVAAAQASSLTDPEDDKKKRLPVNAPKLQRRISRVTVILPKS